MRYSREMTFIFAESACAEPAGAGARVFDLYEYHQESQETLEEEQRQGVCGEPAMAPGGLTSREPTSHASPMAQCDVTNLINLYALAICDSPAFHYDQT